jgi:hypothetical protein
MSSAAQRAALIRQARLSYPRSQSMRTDVGRLVERSLRFCGLSAQALARRSQVSGGPGWRVALPAAGTSHHLGCGLRPDPWTSDAHRAVL